MSHDIPTFRIGTCAHCGEAIAEIRDLHSNARDWYSHGGDFGCDMSPDCNDAYVGSHEPRLTLAMFDDDDDQRVLLPRRRKQRPSGSQPEPADPFSLPDAGTLQDAIRDCALDLFGIASPVTVVSALSEASKD